MTYTQLRAIYHSDFQLTARKGEKIETTPRIKWAEIDYNPVVSFDSDSMTAVLDTYNIVKNPIEVTVGELTATNSAWPNDKEISLITVPAEVITKPSREFLVSNYMVIAASANTIFAMEDDA